MRFPILVFEAVCSIIVSLLAAGFLATVLITLAPGLGTDERELDARLSARTIANIRQSAKPERNVVASYVVYIRGLLHGDLGVSRT